MQVAAVNSFKQQAIVACKLPRKAKYVKPVDNKDFHHILAENQAASQSDCNKAFAMLPAAARERERESNFTCFSQPTRVITCATPWQ